MCQGFGHFPAFLHHFVLAKLATSSIWVKYFLKYCIIVKTFLHLFPPDVNGLWYQYNHGAMDTNNGYIATRYELPHELPIMSYHRGTTST